VPKPISSCIFSSSLHEVSVLLGNEGLEVLLELVGVGGPHPLVLARDDDVHAVGAVADVLVDPVELGLELFGGETHRSQDAKTTGLAYRDHDVTTVGEGEDRKLDSELAGQIGLHSVRSLSLRR